MSECGRRLIVVSNRLPEPGAAGGGGLVTALEPVLRAYRGLWIGLDGGHTQRWIPPPAQVGYRLLPLALRERDVELYYHGLANRTLWPLCHSLLGRTEIRRDFWAAYQRVNRKFAGCLLGEAGPGDLVWVHDYHLMLVPAMLRERGFSGPVGFFLHIPFPPWELFRVLPWREALLEGLLGADVVAFQTRAYWESFLESVRRLLGCPVEGAEIHWRGRQVRVRWAPISIDTAYFEGLAGSAQTRQRVRRLRAGLNGYRVVLGVDRLDYTKGIPERLAAVELLLERHPEYHQRLAFIQVAVPSRTGLRHYRLLKRQIERMVGRINGRFCEGSWTPVRYLYRALPQEVLAAYYALADVALVTPLRDGMNLVAKEYVACRPEGGGGVLVLSEFAGAAVELEGALRVNPHDVCGVAEALHQALSLGAAEQERRVGAMKRHLRARDVRRWAAALLAELEAQRPRRRPVEEAPLKLGGQALEQVVPLG